MLIELIYNMAMVILFILLSVRLKEHLLKSDVNDPYYYKITIAFLAALISIILMKRPFVYHGIAFDLKSIPIFLISYIYSWKYGLVVTSLPAFYRWMLGGEWVIGVIIFEIFFPVIIGGIYHKNKDSIIVTIDKKEIVKAYSWVLIVGFTILIIILDYPLLFWAKIIPVFSISSLFTLLNSTMLINDTNRSIYHNIVKYDNLRQNLIENQNKLEKTKNKMDLIGKLSHEFKTPLNLIFSAVQMINVNKKDNNSISKYTDIIRQNGYRMLRLVNNLIDLVKMDVDSFSLELKNADIVDILNKVTDSVKSYIDNKNRDIKFISDFEKKIIKCDPVNIERIILNLLSNAVKFTEKGDMITVSLYKESDMIKISVKDNGIGIKNNKLKFIFDEFKQIDESMTRNSEGSGLGLSIVKSLVELHEGKITVKSREEKGSEFIVSLPDEKIDGEEIEEFKFKDNINKTALELSDIEF
ncbi:MAG TPA: ATP-binding protein [Halanaerobiales bacterium]|nr:ATP-binding protein [Halanaerobiales bacterium]